MTVSAPRPRSSEDPRTILMALGRRAIPVVRLTWWGLQWLSLAGLLVSLIVWPEGRSVFILQCALLWLLAVWFWLCGSKTVSWAFVTAAYSLSMVWALVIGVVSGDIAESALAVRIGGFVLDGSPSADGAQIALAAVVEESLKIFPVAVMITVAPRLMRTLAATDWLLIGVTIGVAFTAVEDSLRRILAATRSPSIFDMLRDDGSDRSPGWGWEQFGWSPFSGSFVAPTDLAFFPGHHILTASITVGIGLGFAGWHRSRRSGTAIRCATRVGCVLCPVVLWWLAVSVHAGFNATVLLFETGWAAPGSPVPAPIIAGWWITARGWAVPVTLMALLIAAHLLDMRPRIWFADALEVKRGYARRGSEPRSNALLRGRAVTHGIRQHRKLVNRSSWSDSVGSVLLTRGAGMALAVSLLAATVALAPQWAERIGSTAALNGRGQGWLAGVMDGLADWWGGLTTTQQLALTFVGAAVIVLAGGSMGAGFFVSGGVTYLLQHGHGAAGLLRDRRAAVNGYFLRSTPGSVAVDALEALLTFAPAGGSSAAGATGGRLLRSATETAAKDAEAALRSPVFMTIPSTQPQWVHPGWIGEPARGQGTIWRNPWLNPPVKNENTIRIMDPGADPRYPYGYRVYTNHRNQRVDLDWKPGPMDRTHIPNNVDGTSPAPSWMVSE